MSKKKPTFKEAITFAMMWCDAWEKEELSDEVLADRVSELVETRDGARGFLAFSLSSDCPIMDRLPEAVILRLREAKEIVVDLTVRNLAMSSAMSIHHKRNKDYIQKAGSERVAIRCIEVLRLLEPILVKTRIEKLLEAIEGKGDDLDFLKRWGYDNEQKSAIASNLNSIADH